MPVSFNEVQIAFAGNPRGFSVLRITPVSDDEALVLTRVAKGPTGFPEFATHAYKTGSGAFSGHYFTDSAEAHADYFSRVQNVLGAVGSELTRNDMGEESFAESEGMENEAENIENELS